MQLMPSTAARFGVTDPHDPKRAIDAAARYARYLMNHFNGRVDLTLAAYNAGEGAVEAYLTGRSIQTGDKVINRSRRMTGGVPPYRETQNYVAVGLQILNCLAISPALTSVAPREDSSPPGEATRKGVLIVDSNSVENILSTKISRSKSVIRRSFSFTFTVE